MALTYKKAGVDIQGVDRWLGSLSNAIRATHGSRVLKDRGSFAGLFSLPRGLRDPVLVASTDGVGTKLLLARRFGAHEAIGIDAVAMNTNDVITTGAQPLFFLNYLAIGSLNTLTLNRLMRGVIRGCKESGCALLGGETAEMPGVYKRDEYEIAGFCVGVVEKSRLIDGKRVSGQDAVIGLAASGPHANGFSLIRAALSDRMVKSWARKLLAPTRLYVKPVQTLIRAMPVHAVVHVTGGGLKRRLPALVSGRKGLRVRLDAHAWPIPEVFQVIGRAGKVSQKELWATLNMGIGMAVVVCERDAVRAIRILHSAGVPAWKIGVIERK